MQKSYQSGVATHIGPEQCGATRRAAFEALKGNVRPGIQPRKENKTLGDADAVRRRRKAPSGGTEIARCARVPRGSENPVHVRKHLAREPGDPKSAQGRSGLGSVGSLRTYADDGRTWEVGQTC